MLSKKFGIIFLACLLSFSSLAKLSKNVLPGSFGLGRSSPSSRIDITEKPLNNTEIHRDEQEVWLNQIQLGEWLGSGKFSDTFVAIFDPPLDKEYIIKFSGSYDQEKTFADGAAHAVDVVARLSPHPNIPQTLYFARNVSNPFRTGHFALPKDTIDRHTSTGVSQLNVERLRRSPRVSAIISERVRQTHKHLRHHILEVPSDKVRCFWRRLFETLDYAHSKNVIMVDTKLWNVMLQDGELKFFDWNMAMIYESKGDRHERHKSKSTKPYSTCSQGKSHNCDAVHHYDVRKVSKRISEFLDYDKHKRKHHRSNTLPRQDRDYLEDLKNIMAVKHPHSMKWLIEHHSYFLAEDTESCILIW